MSGSTTLYRLGRPGDLRPLATDPFSSRRSGAPAGPTGSTGGLGRHPVRRASAINGIAFSPDGSASTTSTPQSGLVAHDLDADASCNRRILPVGQFQPDGVAVDRTAAMWVADYMAVRQGFGPTGSIDGSRCRRVRHQPVLRGACRRELTS